MATSAAEGIRPLRRVEYDQLVALGAFQDERIELLEGALVAMSPIETLHNATVQLWKGAPRRGVNRRLPRSSFPNRSRISPWCRQVTTISITRAKRT